MEPQDIVLSLVKYKTQEFKSEFLDKTIQYFKNIKKINCIYENEFMLAGIRIHMLYNKLNYYISNIPINSYRKLNLSKNQLRNIEKITSCNFYSTTYFIITPYKHDLPKIKKDTALGLIGLYYLNFLEYKIDCKNCKLTDLENIKKEISKLSELERDRFLFYGDATYNILGTRQSEKIEYIKVEGFDKTIYNMIGADAPTVLINTKYHFYFNGLKFISIFGSVQKQMNDCEWHTFADVYLLKLINGIDFTEDICIKDLVKHKGSVIIRTESDIKNMYKLIQGYLKKYKIEVSLSFLNKHFIKCSSKFNTIYKRRVLNSDPLIREQIGFHRKISQKYIFKYGYDKDYLLDMGSGKLSGSYIYKNAKIKNVFGVEPSIYSVKMAYDTAKKYPSVNFTIINDYADKPLKIKQKFDIITFIFTIHYMMKNINVVIDNIKNLANSGCKIIITCVNGNKVKSLMKNKKYEIKHNNDTYWGVYDIGKSEYMFYMKDVYGLELGSKEQLVDVKKLIKIFKTNSINLIYESDFKSEHLKKNKLPLKFQLDILNMQHILIFQV